MSVDLDAVKSRLTVVLDGLLAHWPIPGGVVSIVADGEVVLQQPFGYADLAARTPVRPEHRFAIGSISKVFTSLVINQLIDEGAFTLDTRVTRLLPWLVLPHGAGEVTVRQLLTHTAGLVAGVDGVPDELAQLWAMRDTDASPASDFFHYSNLGFVLLGQIVTAATGQPLAEAVRVRVLEPAGMTHTLAEIRNADRPVLAVGYAPLLDDSPWLPEHSLVPATWLEASAGDGNIAADAADMTRFLRVLLASGKLEGKAVISTDSFARIVGNLAPEGEETFRVGGHEPVLSSRYGLGVNVEDTAATRLLTHGGGMVGYASFLLADVGRGLGVVVLTNANGDTPIAELIAREAHAALLAPAVVTASMAGDFTPSVWVRRDEMAGRFVSSARDADGQEGDDRAIELRFTDTGELWLGSGGRRGRMLWTLQDRCACEHPDFSLFHFWFDDGPQAPAWVYGPQRFSAETAPDAHEASHDDQTASEALSAFEGHYRSHSPWFTNFRVFHRSGRLYLCAASGVEAPTSEQELVQLEPGYFRIGADSRLPERVRFGPVVGGRAISVNRDGCGYSRTFTR